MLVLSRRKEESVVIPDLGVTIKVLGIRGKQVRLGFQAPEFVEIVRQELHDLRSSAVKGACELEISLTN